VTVKLGLVKLKLGLAKIKLGFVKIITNQIRPNGKLI
jgi:hypothetical protein